MVFVSFAPRTVNAANINEITAMTKGRMMTERKSLQTVKVHGKKSKRL